MNNVLGALFSPYTLNKLTLDNRIVTAPMTREFSPNAIPGDDVAGYYRRRAEGGTGLIITEGTTVNDPVASMGESIPAFHGEQALAGWKKVVEEVHGVGGKICPQLGHVGIARDPASAGETPMVLQSCPHLRISSEGKILVPRQPNHRPETPHGSVVRPWITNDIVTPEIDVVGRRVRRLITHRRSLLT